MKEDIQPASIIFGSIVAGTVFAVIMTIFDYLDERNITVWMFLLYFFLFGLFWGLSTFLGRKHKW
ncbi:hypothetical protein [Tenacibaculum amylolyticum]|uniref:hypothetical protein n=1 Tax=Tenacibaculum amylolyticum TaxID=104269 RepID=UPI0038B49044